MSHMLQDMMKVPLFVPRLCKGVGWGAHATPIRDPSFICPRCYYPLTKDFEQPIQTPSSSSPPFSVSQPLEAVSIKQSCQPRILLVENLWHNKPPSLRPTYTLFLWDLGVRPPPTKSIWTTNLPSWTFSPQPQMLQERDLFDPKLLRGSINQASSTLICPQRTSSSFALVPSQW